MRIGQTSEDKENVTEYQILISDLPNRMNNQQGMAWTRNGKYMMKIPNFGPLVMENLNCSRDNWTMFLERG